MNELDYCSQNVRAKNNGLRLKNILKDPEIHSLLTIPVETHLWEGARVTFGLGQEFEI